MTHFKIDFFDVISILAKSKRLLIFIFLVSLFGSYGFIYFFVAKEYDSSATIIPSGQNQLAGISSLVKNFSSMLPTGLSSINKESEMDLYNTIIYSRSCIENLIDTFDLQMLYKIKQRDSAIKTIRKTIKTSITMDNAYTIKVRTLEPELASKMVNYLIAYLNSKIIELNIAKSQSNRIFLEKRYKEICLNLQNAEDSLKHFQETNGILDASDQLKYSVELFAKLESDLAAKQVEYNVLRQIYGTNAPSVSSTKLTMEEFEKKLNKLKLGQDKGSTLIGLNALPQKTLNYYRYYRNVKISESILEIILPIFEQSKIEEQKNIPVLQVIDYAIPPEKKSYPPRTTFSFFISIITVSFAASFLIFKQVILSDSNNPKINNLKKELFTFK